MRGVKPARIQRVTQLLFNVAKMSAGLEPGLDSPE